MAGGDGVGAVSQGLLDDLGVTEQQFLEIGNIAHLINEDKYILRFQGIWHTSMPITKQAAIAHLKSRGWPKASIHAAFERSLLQITYGFDLAPNRPEILESRGLKVINTWVPPKLQPTPGPFPHVELALEWLTADRDAKPDPKGRLWLEHWMAAKVQNPNRVPKVAVVFATGQGAGKNHLAGVLRHILGPENTEQIDHEALTSRFNARWVDKLFVFADEVVTGEGIKDISNRLKILIDSGTVTLEGKGTNQRSITSRLAWWFASNDRSIPVVIDEDDRRYTVFANYARPSEEYKAKLKACYDSKITTIPTAAFVKEIEGFWAYLLDLKVDFEWIREPYRNAARESLIGSNQHSVDYFATQINRHGLDEHRAPVLQANGKWEGRTWDFSGLPEWEGKEEVPVASGALYACYKDFTLKTGKMKVSQQRFETHLRNSKVWDEVKVKDGNREVDCWLVPKKPTVRIP